MTVFRAFSPTHIIAPTAALDLLELSNINCEICLYVMSDMTM